jgi:hypothetical protein
MNAEGAKALLKDRGVSVVMRVIHPSPVINDSDCDGVAYSNDN